MSLLEEINNTDSSTSLEEKIILAKKLLVDDESFEKVGEFLISYCPLKVQMKFNECEEVDAIIKSAMKKKEKKVIESFFVKFFQTIFDWYIKENEYLKSCLLQYVPSILLIFLTNKTVPLPFIHSSLLLIYNHEISRRIKLKDDEIKLRFPKKVNFDYVYNGVEKKYERRDDGLLTLKNLQRMREERDGSKVDVDEKIKGFVKNGYRKEDFVFLKKFSSPKEEQHFLMIIFQVLNERNNLMRENSIIHYAKVCKIVFTQQYPFPEIPEKIIKGKRKGLEFFQGEFLKKEFSLEDEEKEDEGESDSEDEEEEESMSGRLRRIHLSRTSLIEMVKFLKFCLLMMRGKSDIPIEAMYSSYLRVLYEQDEYAILYVESLLNDLLKK